MKIAVTDQFRHCAARTNSIINPGFHGLVTSDDPDNEVSFNDLDRLQWWMFDASCGGGRHGDGQIPGPLFVIDGHPEMTVDLVVCPFFNGAGDEDGLLLEANLGCMAGDDYRSTTVVAHLDTATVDDLVPHALRTPDGDVVADVTLLDQVVGFTELVADILTDRMERDRNFWAGVTTD